MRKLTLMAILTLPVAGCMSAGSLDALCDGTEAARREHAAALADDGGPKSVVTGARLIRLTDAGCKDAQ